jgi:hypothetical protein
MGRSPNFTIESVPRYAVLPVSETLKQLKKGDKIKIIFKEFTEFKIARSISIYNTDGYDYEQDCPIGITKKSEEPIYEITNVDAIEEFHKIGLNVISLIPANHLNPEKYRDTWYITTDGYSRECEHFTVLSQIESIQIM